MEAYKNGGYLDKIKIIREKRNLLDPDTNWASRSYFNTIKN
jgi:hypothetical protein